MLAAFRLKTEILWALAGAKVGMGSNTVYFATPPADSAVAKL